MSPLHYRIYQLSHAHKLSHIGSCITTVDMLDEIYASRAPTEPVCLGNAHAGLALYVVLEKWLGVDPEMMLAKHGIHSTKDLPNGVYVSGGSLGQVETIAMGMALADRGRRVWLVSSDGGAAEGAFWETLMHKSIHRVDNLRWMVNANGFGAYRAINVSRLASAIHVWDESVRVVKTEFGVPFLSGQSAHYVTMTDQDMAWVEANR